MAEWRSFDRFHHTRENNVLDEEEISTFDMANVNKSNNNCDKVYSSKEYCVRCKPLAKMKNYEIMKEICLTQDCPGFLGIDAKIVSKFFDISYFHIRVLSKIFFFSFAKWVFPTKIPKAISAGFTHWHSNTSFFIISKIRIL